MKKTQLTFIGNSCISNLESILKKDLPQNIFLVTGKNSFNVSGAKSKFQKLLSKYSYIQFSDFEGNPNSIDVKRGINYFRKNKCDYVIAIGGGSVIDMAKLINIGQSNEKNICELAMETSNIINCGKKLIAIPTTAGSGSEATHFAVVYIDGKKYSLAHKEFILPDVAIIIPSLTYSLDGEQTSVSGLDALSQAIEAYWSVNSDNNAKKYASKAIKIILKSLPIAINKGEYDARDNMAIASNLAGKAINISKTTGPHAMSYILTSAFGIKHGHAVALSLGEWYNFNSKIEEQDCNDIRGVKYVRNTISELNQLLGTNCAIDSMNRIRYFINIIGLKSRLSELGVKKIDLKYIASNINLSRLENNPRRVTNTAIYKIINNIY